ncbi:KinB sensor domain-containing domain, partial [Pseudomonas avellanae]|uniref:KinB sensor domain-containing domain n=1 Tax=Pseudomonas avellanae TaxID=46257 RepID=UPI000463F3AE
MKLAMKLRTRLFLSISALITVALLGLLLGLVSVMQMARTQESLIQHNFAILDLGLKLRQNLGDQLVLMTGANRNPPELEKIQRQFEELLEEASAQDTQQDVRNGLEGTRADYRRFIDALKQFGTDPRGIRGNPQLSESFDSLRNGLLNVHRKALENISSAEINSRDRALWIAGLLGLVGLAVLCIGFVTAHGIARRFGAPIEALAKAADRIGEGDYEVTLPISSAAEMNLLTRRFGIMAEALRQHQATNVDELLAGQQRLQAV